MRLHRHVFTATLLAASAASLPAQATTPTLRPMPSGRATVEVTLTPPRVPAGAASQAATPAMPATAAMPAMPATPATPVTIRLEYGQPHLRGRSINTDTLVPFDQPWRTGANSATTLTTGIDLVIGGQPVPRGTYVIWTLPTRTGWTLMVQRSDAPGTMQAAMVYDKAKDVARVALRQQVLAMPMESLTMWLVPSTAAGAARGELRMAWGTTMLSTDWMVR